MRIALVTVTLMLVAIMAPSISTADPIGPTDPTMPMPPGSGCYYSEYDCGSGTGDTGVGPTTFSATGGCKTRWARATRKNLAYQTVFTYYEQVRWCWSNSHVTYLKRDRWPADTHYGWSFDGHIGGSCANEYCSGLIGAWSETAWTQGHFHVCLGALGINYCSHKYPRVSITVYGNGSSTGTWTGA